MVPADRLGAIHDLLRGEVWSRDELAGEIARRAKIIDPHLSGADDYVVIAYGGTPAFFADLFAVWEAGACAVCVNPNLTAGEFENVAEFVKPRVVLVGEEDRPQLDGVSAPRLRTGDRQLSSASPSRDAGSRSARSDDPALMLFTSGTTGTPKGVVHTFRSLWARCALNLAYIGERRLEKTLCILPTHFGHGLIGNCLTPLLAGKDLFLFPDTSLKGAAALSGTLDDHSITFMSSVPAFWRVALKVARPPQHAKLQQINIGSAPLSAELWQEVIEWSGTDNVVNMYGITETANWVAGASARTAPPEDGLVGTMWGGHAMVKDTDGVFHAQGEGELVLLTPSVMAGYHLSDHLTRTVLRNGWFHTGDIGTIGEDGSMRLTGRLKSEINRAGIKVQPEEVDLLLERHPDIAEACTFGVPDAVSGEIVAAAVCLTDGTPELDTVALRSWCAERIRRESIPERWFFVSEIPKTDRGKINRNHVRDHCL